MLTEYEMVGWDPWLNGHEFEWAPGMLMYSEAWHPAVHGVEESQTQLSYWTELNWTECIVFFIFYIFKNLFILIGG